MNNQFHSAISGYQLRGYKLPHLYNYYPNPYKAYFGTRAKIVIEALSATPADYDDFFFVVKSPIETSKTAVASQGFGFDDDAAPPSNGSTIKIQGLTTQAEIAEQIALSINTTGYGPGSKIRLTARNVGAKVFVEQNFAGARGNTLITIGNDLSGILAINGILSYASTAPNFFGGADYVPARFGMNRALILGTHESSPTSPVEG